MSLADAFTRAPVNPSDDMPEDGTYQAVVHRFDVIEAKSGKAYLKTEFQIAHDAKYEGRVVATLHQVDDPEVLLKGWLKQHLHKLGVDVEALEFPDSPQELERFVTPTIGTPVQVTIKTNRSRLDNDGNPRRNVYLDQRLGGPIAPVSRGGTSTEQSFGMAASDVPF